MSFTNVNPQHLKELSRELRRLMDAELAAGNTLVETGSGWPRPHSVTVKLKKPFTVALALKSDHVEYREINDPHWWKAEFEHDDDMLMCDF